MEVATTYETSVNFYDSTRRYNPEDRLPKSIFFPRGNSKALVKSTVADTGYYIGSIQA